MARQYTDIKETDIQEILSLPSNERPEIYLTISYKNIKFQTAILAPLCYKKNLLTMFTSSNRHYLKMAIYDIPNLEGQPVNFIIISPPKDYPEDLLIKTFDINNLFQKTSNPSDDIPSVFIEFDIIKIEDSIGTWSVPNMKYGGWKTANISLHMPVMQLIPLIEQSDVKNTNVASASYTLEIVPRKSPSLETSKVNPLSSHLESLSLTDQPIIASPSLPTTEKSDSITSPTSVIGRESSHLHKYANCQIL